MSCTGGKLDLSFWSRDGPLALPPAGAAGRFASSACWATLTAPHNNNAKATPIFLMGFFSLANFGLFTHIIIRSVVWPLVLVRRVVRDVRNVAGKPPKRSIAVVV